MRHLTLKQIGKIIFWLVFALVLLCPAHLEGEWHFWPQKLFTQGIEPAGKELALRCAAVMILGFGKLLSGTGRRWEVRRTLRGWFGGHPLLFDPHEEEPMDKALKWTEEKKEPKAVLNGDGILSRREVEAAMACLTARGFAYRFSKSYGEEVYTYQKDGLKVELYNSKDTFYCMVKEGKKPMAEFSKSTLLQDFQRIPYREANEERKLQIIADVLKEL